MLVVRYLIVAVCLACSIKSQAQIKFNLISTSLIINENGQLIPDEWEGINEPSFIEIDAENKAGRFSIPEDGLEGDFNIREIKMEESERVDTYSISVDSDEYMKVILIMMKDKPYNIILISIDENSDEYIGYMSKK